MKARRLLTLGHSYVVSLNRRLAREMARAGGGNWEVTCAAPRFFHGGNDLAPVTLLRGPADDFPLVELDAHFTSKVHVFAYSWGLRTLLRQPWDVVHAWEEPYILAGWQISRLVAAQTKLVYRTAQSNAKIYPPPFSWFENASMARAAGWICSGRTVEGCLRTRSGYDRPHLLSPLGVDVDVFKPDPDARRHARERLGWDVSGPPVIGFIGRFVAAKGVRFLTQVLDQVREPFRVLFLGAGALEHELRRWGEKHGDRVRVLYAPHDDVAFYTNAMDVLCAPSQTTAGWREQFGRMLVEAMACAVPVIGSDSGEIQSVIGDAGVVVGEQDVAGWARAIEQLLVRPERRKELGAAGVELTRAQYAWPIIARKYLDFFDSL
jgi:glycosyltransferase involved in cell wall biosynthesis